MRDVTFADEIDTELDAHMAGVSIDQGAVCSGQVDEMVQCIRKYQPLFRTYLSDQGYIQMATDEQVGFELAAVDGASAVQVLGGGSFVTACAYKCTFNSGKQHGVPMTAIIPNKVDSKAYADILRMHLEFSLLSQEHLDNDQIIIVDHSFWGLLQSINRAVSLYKERLTRHGKASPQPLGTDAMTVAWQELFVKVIGQDGSFLNMMKNKRIISLSKQAISQFFVGRFRYAYIPRDSPDQVRLSSFNDRLFLRHVLQPGEYTSPQLLYSANADAGNSKTSVRSKFATRWADRNADSDPFTSREDVLDEYGIPRDDGTEMIQKRLFLTYYRPYEWSRAYRIEFHESLLDSDYSGQGHHFQMVLAAMRNSIVSDIAEPITQYLADLRSKAATTCYAKVVRPQVYHTLSNRYDADELHILQSIIAEERA